MSLDWEYRVRSAVPSEVHSLLKEVPGSGRLAASAVKYRLCSFLMYFKHSWDYQELSFTNGSVEGQSLSVPAPLQQLGGGAILLLSPATGLPEESNMSLNLEFPQEVPQEAGEEGKVWWGGWKQGAEVNLSGTCQVT